MSNNQKIFTPAEAADYLTVLVGRKITVARLAQLRRAGKVEGITKYNTTIYTQEALERAAPDIKLGNPEDHGDAPSNEKKLEPAA